MDVHHAVIINLSKIDKKPLHTKHGITFGKFAFLQFTTQIFVTKLSGRHADTPATSCLEFSI